MSLNPQQQEAVDTQGHCLIVACPGSGKTFTLVQRASRLLHESSTSRLAIVTFTRSAADELKQRLVKAIGPAILPRVDAGTFHSLCLKQLPALFGDGPGKTITIASEAETHLLIAKAWQGALAKFPKSGIRRDEVQKAIEFAKANRMLLPPSQHQDAIRFAIDSYQGQLRAQKLVDFADIIALTVQGMESGQIPPLSVQDMLVDEFQDADATQIAWVLAHVSFGVRVTCVGDDDQSIYGFRHGKGYAGMMQFANQAGAKIIRLDTTYRCAAPVIAHASRLIAKNTERVAKLIKTANRQSGTVERVDAKSIDDELTRAADWMEARPAGETAAIIGRTNSVLRSAMAELQSRNIPFKGIENGEFWRAGFPGLAHGLMGAIAGKKPSGITMVLSARGMTSAATGAARDALQAGGGKPDVLLQSTAWLKGLPSSQVEIWEAIRGSYEVAIRAGQTARDRGMAPFADACDKLILPGMSDFTTKKMVEVVHAALVAMKGDIGENYQRIERSMRTKNADDESPRAVALLTLHASKGLEFDRVWIPAVRQGVLPHANTDLDEERRLFYVGMTRAKRFLTVSYSRGKDAPESQFLGEAGLLSANAVHLAKQPG